MKTFGTDVDLTNSQGRVKQSSDGSESDGEVGECGRARSDSPPIAQVELSFLKLTETGLIFRAFENYVVLAAAATAVVGVAASVMAAASLTRPVKEHVGRPADWPFDCMAPMRLQWEDEMIGFNLEGKDHDDEEIEQTVRHTHTHTHTHTHRAVGGRRT